MKTQIIRAGALPIALATFVAAMPAAALEGAPAAPGALPNDKSMTCQDIATERTAINEAVLATVAKQQQARKTKKRLFGFAKTLATIAVPGAGLLVGGSSFGSMAAQQAGQAALDVVGNGGTAPAAAPAVAKPSDAQQARLTRLDSIAALRQCAA